MNLTKTILKLIGGCAVITLLGGCASVICGPRQAVSIDSKPTGAEVMVYNPMGEVVFHKTTPCVAKLDRRNADYGAASYVLLIRKAGFGDIEVPMNGCVNKAFYANLLFGGLGMAVDPITGGMWTLCPGDVDAKLVKENADFFHHDGLLIVLKEQLPEELQAALKPVAPTPAVSTAQLEELINEAK